MRIFRSVGLCLIALILGSAGAYFYQEKKISKLEKMARPVEKQRRGSAKEYVYQHTKNMVMNEYTLSHRGDVFNASAIFDDAVDTWQEVNQALLKNFEKHRPMFEKDWPLKEKERLVAYFLNFVNSMWGTGPGPHDDAAVGGIVINPKVPDSRAHKEKFVYQGEPIPMLSKLTIKDYLNASYAECTEYSVFLSVLLHMNGFPTKMVATFDHIYVETEIDGRPFVVDALHNFMVPLSNEEFLTQDKGDKVVYHLFPLSGSNPIHRNHYRSKRGQRRYFYLLTRGRIYQRIPLVATPLNRAEKWIRLNYIPLEDFLEWDKVMQDERKKNGLI